MPDKAILFAILICGASLSAIYMMAMWCIKKCHPQFLNVAMIFGSSAGLVSGVKLCYTVCVDDTRFLVGNDDKATIFVGGLAICWVSVLGIIEAFKVKFPKN